MTRLLVTGAGGMLGQDVVEAARRVGHEVAALGRRELDITDARAVAAAIEGIEPAAVINCAAWTDVDGAELHETEAHAVNALGPGLLGELAATAGVRLVHISTDYVFDGTARRPYVESDPPAPTCAYGRTKLAGEQAVLAAGGDHAVLRTAWLFGPGGHNFVSTMLGLAAERKEVAVVTDQVGCPTFTGHLAPALVELAERRGAGIYHATGGEHCSWNEFAVEIFAQAGVDCRVVPSNSLEQKRRAVRPAWSVLGSERPDPIELPAWQAGLAAYLERTREALTR